MMGRPPRLLERKVLSDLYWSEGKSLGEIAKILKTSKGLVLREMVRLGVPRRTRVEGWLTKKEVIRAKISKAKKGVPVLHPDLSPSPELSYIIGVYLGDGYLVQNKKLGYGIGLGTKDRSFADKFSFMLRSIGLNPYITETRMCGKPFWRVTALSIALYKLLKDYKLQKKVNPDKVKEIAIKFPREFIAGFYDSEGGLAKHKEGHVEVNIWNKDEKLLLLVKEISENLGVHFRFHRRHTKDLCYLSLYRKDEIRYFFSLVSPSIDRKKLELN